MVRVAVLLIAVMVLLSVSPGSSQTSYTTTTVQCSRTQVNVSGISSAGSSSEVVGQWIIHPTSHAYYAPVNGSTIGTCTNIDPPGATFARGIGINEQNQIVGFYQNSLGQSPGFTYNPTNPPQWRDFNIRGLNQVTPNGINGNGVVVGDYPTGGVRYGFAVTTSIVNGGIVPDNDAVTGITFQAGTTTNINGVNTVFNNKTYFVGDSGYGEHGFWGTITVSTGPSISVSPLTRFDCQGATYTRPLGVDNHGLMVGRMTINKTNYAFTTSFNGTTFNPVCNTSYPVQPSKDTAFTGSNASTGQLVGFSGSAQNGFLLTPSLP